MSLLEYKRKRKFSGSGKTIEPKGKIKSSGKNIFVIHEHHASHLHWDLRLEENGVLKSWAIPKEPPTEKGIKRLAVHVEDHPLAYAKFHGTIPEGNYGAGKVEIWDKGTYELLEKNPNSMKIKIHGKRLRGDYILVKTNFGKKKNGWLFFRS
ncbi:MAG: 3'-phosphoesterase [Candidatus Pacearchaeota archaeon]|nr:3'-phosphoesterase [Candidatus Pacearchaeota archaeon]MDE1848977.1 3'-phosphoesterase [Nanoarchaeota archaeon]